MKIQNDGGAGEAEALERIRSDSGEGRTFTRGELAEAWPEGEQLQAYDKVVQMRLQKPRRRLARRQRAQLFVVVDYLLNTHIPRPGEGAVCRKCGTGWPCSVVIDIGEQLPPCDVPVG